MPHRTVALLDADAKLIRLMLQLRVALWTSHGARAILAGGDAVVLDHSLEVEAIDAALRLLGIEAPALSAGQR